MNYVCILLDRFASEQVHVCQDIILFFLIAKTIGKYLSSDVLTDTSFRAHYFPTEEGGTRSLREDATFFGNEGVLLLGTW